MLIGVFLVLFRLLMGGADRDRIEMEVKARGGRVRSITWAPFGKGWVGERNDRIYEVEYVERSGLVRRVWCKTNMLSGVYFSEMESSAGRTAAHSNAQPAAQTTAQLEQRVQDLEAENERLRRQAGDRGD